MYIRVNGMDIMPYLDENGFKWSRNDLDSSDAGRTLDGIMHRGRITTKARLDLTFKPLPEEQMHTVMQLLYPEYVTVEYSDPLFGERSARMYSNNINTTLRVSYNARKGLWNSFSAPLIER